MAVTYHAGRRIQGTNADRVGSDAISGGWKELGRTTLGSSGDTISVSSLPDKRYYMVLADGLSTTGVVNKAMRFNNDSGSNYSRRFSQNGGSDGTSINKTEGGHTVSTNEEFFMAYISNLSSKEKLVLGQTIAPSTAGAGTAPTRMETVFKWTNTSSAINRIDEVNIGSGDYTSGSEVVVLGWDPDDTHTDNFWEELASVELGGANATLDTSTFTAKKYLYWQAWVDCSGSTPLGHIRFNNDSTGNYSDRRSDNGGADATNTSSGSMRVNGTGDTTPRFYSGFIINNASNEKLAITHEVRQSTAGAGTAPQRCESVGKWANTSNQITQIQLVALSSTWTAGSIIKVWGSN